MSCKINASCYHNYAPQRAQTLFPTFRISSYKSLSGMQRFSSQTYGTPVRRSNCNFLLLQASRKIIIGLPS